MFDRSSLRVRRSSGVRRPSRGVGYRRRRTQVGTVLCALLVAGAVAGGCGGSQQSGAGGGTRQGVTVRGAAPAPSAALSKSTATTTTTMPQCGSSRDPFDPTNSPPPPGSPALC